MQRRTFLKDAAIGIGTIIGMCNGILDAEDVLHDPRAALSGAGEQMEAEKAGQLTWGTSSIILKSPWSASPDIGRLLSDKEHTLVLDRFYRVGGDNRPLTRTECHIAYCHEALLVAFRCSESNMSFPYANLDPKVWLDAGWESLSGLPAASNNWPPYPDEVDLLIKPDTNSSTCFQFAATPQGMKFGCVRPASSAQKSPIPAKKVEAFGATVTRRDNEWLVFFEIPWQALGGRPCSHFGLLPMRTRWRDGEYTSPVALDFMESTPLDLLIETHFSDPGRAPAPQGALIHMPSGALRWQRPATLTHPSVNTCRAIWRMASSLDNTPTQKSNLGERLYLTQRLMDLMMLEGFTPLPRAWGVLKDDLTLASFRQNINAALQKNDVEHACRQLDTYLSQLGAMSKWWYADGSPANILVSEWKPITKLNSMEAQGNQLLMRCVAGGHEIDLHLVLPSTGGIRLHGKGEGYWRPTDLLPLKASETASSCSIETADGQIVIQKEPFSISLLDRSGKTVLHIASANLAFRFSPAGDILASDFKHRLDRNEVIYGFGEKYDHFNQNGNALTLWGTDDWVGNGTGLANTTYKPLPILRSSRPYLLFINSSYRIRADIGKTRPDEFRITQNGPIVDYYFWIGTPEATLNSYTALTGRVPLPPKWAFEPWMGRGGDAWAGGPMRNAVAEEQNAATRFAELDIPHSAIYAEGPSALSPELNQFMAKRGIHVLGYFMPAVGPSRQAALMPEKLPSELPVLHCGSDSETEALGYIDFSHPNAAELCRRALKEALDLGEAGSMVDFGDMVPDNAEFHGGQHAPGMHNFYYYEYQKTISQIFQEKRGDDFVLYARGAAPGTQHWVGQFAGDHPANFEGLRHVLTGALNLCACGYSNWGSDLGGYFGFPQPAVYMRWMQFGCFSPLMRPHGTAPREPWYFSPQAVENYKFLAWVRENILNYTYNSAVIAHERGVSIMRSMPIAFPDEPRLASLDDQYMFGPSLLVAPVVDEQASRTIAFPSGAWFSLWDGKQFSGPDLVKVDAPLNTIPVYLKSGAVVPVQLDSGLQFGASMTHSRIDALVTTIPGRDESVSLLNTRGERAKVTMHLQDRGFCWSLEALPEMRYLVLYGRSIATSVRVDGKALPKSEIADLNSVSKGWGSDSANNRLVVSLPQNDTDQGTRTINVEVDVR